MSGPTSELESMRTHRSGEEFVRLQEFFPGGDLRPTTFHAPYPLTLASGYGCRVRDLDGNEFIDLGGNFGSLVHGHAHPDIVAAIRDQAARGVVFASPSTIQVELARRIRERFDGLERVRFTNSGTEAAMFAVRAARAVTGRDEILKAVGGYHGSWEQLPFVPARGDDGVPDTVRDLVHWVDFNDVEQLRDVVSRMGERLASIVLEPVLGAGGVIAGDPEFLETARELADEVGAVLIFDEVLSGRVASGGYQSVVGVRPHLTTLGKLIGGGMAIGAVGGDREIMEVFDPHRPSFVAVSGTFHGNAVTMAAGCAALDLYTEAEIDRLNGLGDLLRGELERLFESLPIDLGTTVCGSLLQIHPTRQTSGIRHFGDTKLSDPIIGRLHAAALRRGLFFPPRGLLCLSTPMDEAVVGDAVERLASTCADLLGEGVRSAQGARAS